jgi:hypothetical protein
MEYVRLSLLGFNTSFQDRIDSKPVTASLGHFSTKIVLMPDGADTDK